MRRLCVLGCLLLGVLSGVHRVKAGDNAATTPEPAAPRSEIDVLAEFGGGARCTKATLDAAISSIGDRQASLLLRPGTWVVDESLTIPSNMTLHLSAGAVISVTAGKTVTIAGPLVADGCRIFDGEGEVAGLTEANVVWFGAVGDNVHDDTRAIQNAIRAVTRGTVRFGVGNFKVSSPIGLKRFVDLVGPERCACRIRPVAQFAGNVFEMAAPDGPTLAGLSIRHLTIEGEEKSPTTGCGFFFKNFFDIVFEDVTIGYCNEGVHLEGGWGHYLQNVYAGNNVAVAFYVGSEYSHLLNLSSDGAEIALHLVNAQGAKVTDCHFEGASVASVKLSGVCRGTRLISNFLTRGGTAGTPDGIIDDAGSHQMNMIFANNYILTTGNGIRITNPGPAAYGNVIQGNCIMAGLCGIELANQGFNVVEGNNVSSKVGIVLRTGDAGNSNVISGNQFSCTETAILHDSPGSNTTYGQNAIQSGAVNIVSGTPNVTHANQAGTFAWNTKSPKFTVRHATVTANSVIVLFPANAAAAKMVGSEKSPYILGKTAGESFTVSTADGGDATGSETFHYWITN